MSFDNLRGTKEQLKDEFAAAFKRMTDPQEQEKVQQERVRAELLDELETDAGI